MWILKHARKTRERGKGINTVTHAARTLRKEDWWQGEGGMRKGCVDFMNTLRRGRKESNQDGKRVKARGRLEFVPEVLMRVCLGLIAVFGPASGRSRDKVEEAVFAGRLFGDAGSASFGIFRKFERVGG